MCSEVFVWGNWGPTMNQPRLFLFSASSTVIGYENKCQSTKLYITGESNGTRVFSRERGSLLRQLRRTRAAMNFHIIA